MSKYRILYDEYGRTGNRLFAYLDSLGWAISQGGKVVILFPERFLASFDAFRNSRYVSLPLWNKGQLWWRVARKVFFYNALAQKFYKTALSRNLGFLSGWNDCRNSNEHWPAVKAQIQQLFLPNADVQNPINEAFAAKRIGGGKIIGVHIRREDYKTAYSGVWYYDDDVYRAYMKQMEALLPGCAFYISSTDKIAETYSQEFDVVKTPLCSAAADIYALSQCDYIIGPPSTFNAWASFVGDVPLFSLYKRDLQLSLDKFELFPGMEAWWKKIKQNTGKF